MPMDLMQRHPRIYE